MTLVSRSENDANGQDATAQRVSNQLELRRALLRLDLRLRLAVDGQRDDLAERTRDPFRGLYITDADVDELLASLSPADAAERFLTGPAGRVASRLGHLARLFNLDEFEQDALLICLAPDLDLRYERLYAYLQDDVTKRRPTVDLILRLLSPKLEDMVANRAAVGPNGRLLREGILVLSDESAAGLAFLGKPLKVDERVGEYLLGSDQLDARLAGYARLIEPEATSHLDVPGDLSERLARLVARPASASESGPVIYLHGAPGAAKFATLRTVCRVANRSLLYLDLGALLTASKPALLLTLAAREALLRDAVLGVADVDVLLNEGGDLLPIRNHFQSVLIRRAGPTFLLGDARWEPSHWLSGIRAMRVDLPALGPAARLELWRAQLDGRVPPDDVTDLAARYRLDGDAIESVLSGARLRAEWRGATDVEAVDIRRAAAAFAAPPLGALARRVEPRYGWDDIVLTPDGYAQLREICDRARHSLTVLDRWGFGRKHARRHGLTALFAGQPGTGKTMAAEVIANALSLELYRIDLSSVVSKYIGETEKNLEQIFRAADHGDAVLLFDEADAIFGKRSEVRDAHDRYANVETAYLLQRLEAYDGMAILTTNLRGNIDEAFIRRLDFVLEFPMPEEAERLAIWRLALPSEAPLAADLDLPFIARKFRLAGGHIRNIALTAAFLAAAEDCPIGMKHVVRATRREYQKQGKMVAPGDFEQYFSLLKDE